MRELTLKVGENHTQQILVKRMLDFGYEKVLLADLQPGQFFVTGGTLKIFPVDSLEIITIDFFGENLEEITVGAGLDRKKVKTIKFTPVAFALNDGSKIRRGDYVVHEDHGIGIFLTLGVKIVQGKKISYIYIGYLNDDILYLPVDLKDKLSLYIGAGRKHPRLSKLGSQTWQKTYKRTYDNIKKMAQELLSLYAKREITSKGPWQINHSWENIVREGFGYLETSDQKKAIADVYQDFAREKPMDRLVCGDVGLGKTEIAIRAISQAIANGYQVAMLVPTTILAEQHFSTMSKRFKGLPVAIDRLSRLVSKDQQTRIAKELKDGIIDLVIGTHRILEKDIEFKKLGLLVVDEEQKFGVKDKEKLKMARENISVLTITATPIPRTLFMALSGLRDVSEINSIPTGRLAVQTKICKYDRNLITEVLERELARSGQIYYLHNDLSTISGVQNWLKAAFPKSSISIAHGQMPEKQLARIMGDFAAGKIDILVCSTIIENGLDLANVNTLIVDNAERFGLSQLHQIRGRIGRSDRQSYAFFTYPEKVLTENALKRFQSLADFSEIGDGYNIALSDLEIRGGGNVLGREQHGNMEAIGLMLYTKLLKLAVNQLKADNHRRQNLL